MSWLTKWFGSKQSSQMDQDFFDACSAFVSGKMLFKEAASFKGSREIKLSKVREALNFFDEAIEKGPNKSRSFSGFDEAEVFSLRGFCLNDLGFYFEALEDFNKAIEKNSRKNIPSHYHMRSMIKDSLFDFEGSLADLKEAIRLSKFNNEENAYWNDYAKITGFASQSAFFESCLPAEDEAYCKKSIYSDRKFVEERLKAIKRREK